MVSEYLKWRLLHITSCLRSALFIQMPSPFRKHANRETKLAQNLGGVIIRTNYFTSGIDSLETSLEQLALNTDRNLRASILLGFHAVSCLLKAAAVELGLVVTRGDKSINFPSVVGALKAKGLLESTDSKALQLLNELRNALEHREVDYDRESYQIALH